MQITNRRAWHDFHILEKVECGIELLGTEVKSLRGGQMRIDDAYARIRDGQVYLVGANIAPYERAAPGQQHQPDRERRLLLHRRQIRQLEIHARQKGRTIVPLGIHFSRGWAKVELGVAEGKRQYDKRHAIKERQTRRDMARETRRHTR